MIMGKARVSAQQTICTDQLNYGTVASPAKGAVLQHNECTGPMDMQTITATAVPYPFKSGRCLRIGLLLSQGTALSSCYPDKEQTVSQLRRCRSLGICSH